MKVQRIQVLTNRTGADLVNVWPEGLTTPFPKLGDPEVTLTISVEKDYGIQWARKNFPGVSIETINTENGAREVLAEEKAPA